MADLQCIAWELICADEDDPACWRVLELSWWQHIDVAWVVLGVALATLLYMLYLYYTSDVGGSMQTQPDPGEDWQAVVLPHAVIGQPTPQQRLDALEARLATLEARIQALQASLARRRRHPCA